MDDKNKNGVTFYEAREQIAIVDAMLSIILNKLGDLRSELRDCTQEEYDVLKRANRFSHELYADVVKVLGSVRERKRGG